MQRALGLGWSKVRVIPNRKKNVYEAKLEKKGVEYHIKITCDYFSSDTSLVGEFDMTYEHRKTVMSIDEAAEVKSIYRKEKALFKYARDQGSGGENKVVLIAKSKQYPEECKNLKEGETLLDNEYVALIPTFSLAQDDFLNKFKLMRRMFPWPTVMIRKFSPDGSQLQEELIVETYGGEDLIHTARRLSDAKSPEIMNYNYDVLLRMLAQVVKEIERVHLLDYVHCDVHPANFLVKHFNLYITAVYQLYLKNILPDNLAKLVCEYSDSVPSDWLGLRMIDPGQATKERELVPRRQTAWSAPEAKEPFRKGFGPFRSDSESAVFDRSADMYSFGYLILFLIEQQKKIKDLEAIERGKGVNFSLHTSQAIFLHGMAERCLVRLTDPKTRFVRWLGPHQMAPRPSAKQIHNELVDEFARFQVEKNALLFLGALIDSNCIKSEGFLVVVSDWYKKIAEKKIDVDTLSKKILAGREHFKPLLLENTLLLARYKQFHQSYYEFLLGPTLLPVLEGILEYAYKQQCLLSLRSKLKNVLRNLKKLKTTAIVSSQEFLQLTTGKLTFLSSQKECAELNRRKVVFFDVWNAFQEGIILRESATRVRPLSEDAYSVGRLDITEIYETAGFNPLSTPIGTPASDKPDRYKPLESIDDSLNGSRDKKLATRSNSVGLLPGFDAVKRSRASSQHNSLYVSPLRKKSQDSLQIEPATARDEGKLPFSAHALSKRALSVLSSDDASSLLTSSDISESPSALDSRSESEEMPLMQPRLTLPDGLGQNVLTTESAAEMLSPVAKDARDGRAFVSP